LSHRFRLLQIYHHRQRYLHYHQSLNHRCYLAPQFQFPQFLLIVDYHRHRLNRHLNLRYLQNRRHHRHLLM
jgi:hypothetical protein